MNKIYYDGHWFYDEQIVYGSIHIANAMVCDTLEADTLTVEVKNEAYSGAQFVTSESQDLIDSANQNFEAAAPVTVNLDDYKYGAPLEYYRDDTIIGRFYVESIQKVAVGSSTKYKISCTSVVGLLINKQHMGGMYFQAEAGGIISGLLYGVSNLAMDTDVSETKVSGYLPIATCRDNLQQLLFAIGASILKLDGNPYFTFNQPDQPKTIPSERLYIGGDANYNTQATRVVVTEHTYYEDNSIEDETIFDNYGETPVENKLIKFDEPMWNFVCALDPDNPIKIVESGANYIIVTGAGTVTGRKYGHTQREVSYTPEISAATEKEITVTDATLVSEANSQNVAARVGDYYAQAREISCDIAIEDEKTGDFIEYEDPFKETTTGYIKEMDITMSGVLKANTTIIANWKPKHVGNSYTNFVIVQAADVVDGKWTVPEAIRGKSVMAVIFGGASGGGGGEDGEGGGVSYRMEAFVCQNASSTEKRKVFNLDDIWSKTPGGAGGYGGAGGKPGKMLKVNIESLANEYTVSIGAGGAGGSAGGGRGKEGEHTVFGEYDSDNGSDFSGNYVNVVSGAVYAKAGQDGRDGGDGGLAGTPMEIVDGKYYSYYTTNWKGRDGGDGGYARGEDQDWAGGKGAEHSYTYDDYDSASGVYVSYDIEVCGSGGGGAAYGAAGVDATAPESELQNFKAWSIPGNGADALPPAEAGLGCGGNGGHGGGGGGSAGSYYKWKSKDGETVTEKEVENPNLSTGGKGSAGTAGSDGFVIIYYGND